MNFKECSMHMNMFPEKVPELWFVFKNFSNKSLLGRKIEILDISLKVSQYSAQIHIVKSQSIGMFFCRLICALTVCHLILLNEREFCKTRSRECWSV